MVLVLLVICKDNTIYLDKILVIKQMKEEEGGAKLTTETGVIPAAVEKTEDIRMMVIKIGIIMTTTKTTTIIRQTIEMMEKIATKTIMKIGNSHYLATWFNQFILEHPSSTQFLILLQYLHLHQLLQLYKPNLNLLLIMIKNNKKIIKINKKNKSNKNNKRNNKIIAVLVLVLLKMIKKKKNQ